MDEVEMRLTIKLMIHSFRREGNAFHEYTKLCQLCAVGMQTNSQLRVLHTLLLQDLKELLDMLEPRLRSEDEPVLGILRQAHNQSNSRQFLVD